MTTMDEAKYKCDICKDTGEVPDKIYNPELRCWEEGGVKKCVCQLSEEERSRVGNLHNEILREFRP
jgi:hypothetical protein